MRNRDTSDGRSWHEPYDPQKFAKRRKRQLWAAILMLALAAFCFATVIYAMVFAFDASAQEALPQAPDASLKGLGEQLWAWASPTIIASILGTLIAILGGLRAAVKRTAWYQSKPKVAQKLIDIALGIPVNALMPKEIGRAHV